MSQDLADDDLVFDLESNGLLMELDRVWVMSIGNVRTGEVLTYTDHDPRFPSLADGITRLSQQIKRNEKRKRRCLIAHNGIGFDVKALRKLRLIDIPLWAVYDTLVMGRLRDPERLGGHKLESYGIEMGILKGVYDGGWDAYSEDMRAYCGQDSVVTIALFEKLKATLAWGESLDLEHCVAYLIDLQMENGFLLDVRRGMVVAAELYDERQRCVAELQQVFPPIYVSAGTKTPKRLCNYKATADRPAYSVVGPYTAIKLQEFNAGSEHHVAMRLRRKYGWIAPTTEKGNPNVTEEVLKKIGDYPEVQSLLKFGKADKRYTQLAGPPKIKNGRKFGGGWLHHTDDSNRVHGFVNSNGAVTGRMTHRMPNSANIDKDARLRALWVPRDGWVLMGCDAEGLELRVLAHYLYPWDKGEFARQLLEGDKTKGTDAHSINRRNTELFSRDGAKTLIYGALYGAGDEKAGRIWIEDWQSSGKPLSEWPRWAVEQSKRDPSRWRVRPAKEIGKRVKTRLIDGIKGFAELKKKIAEKAKSQGYIRGLDGRRIRIRHAHAALNSLLQGAGAIVMKKALVLLHEAITAKGYVHGIDFGYCANVHDEWQIECRTQHLAEEIGEMGKSAITRAGELLKSHCRLDGAFDIGNNWHETH
ncbi:DNA polymerase [Variovorax sp. J22G73]|uniref:DNA polymerase n=1 Tax=unclassified Variovorax TaxID=663243 RepID=UPI002576CC62|nr:MULTISPECIES: DNA polymerase [unclassified Variovorax]MDM0006462.1 DNA polymerase [Variovorax sp. J22R203]MDM0097515.1 DNA polymerase [Variovorax sp. J22G73]